MVRCAAMGWPFKDAGKLEEQCAGLVAKGGLEGCTVKIS